MRKKGCSLMLLSVATIMFVGFYAVNYYLWSSILG